MYLLFDTETTGLPNNWSASANDIGNWPRMVQLAFLLFDLDGNFMENHNYIIKPEGYTIPSEVSKIHGITTERANREGVELRSVLTHFEELTTRATLLVAHNMEFDEKIIGCEFYRAKGYDPLILKQKICTMKSPSVINYCAAPPFRYGNYKWPKLSELHKKLFGTDFEEAHNASMDLHATARCFWELKRIGKI